MLTNESNQGDWPERKLRRLQEQLVGPWASDAWQFKESIGPRKIRYLRLSLVSPSLKIEVKYAAWKKFDSGQCNVNNNNRNLCSNMSVIIRWLNSFTPAIHSLMEKEIEQWILLFRSHLVQTGQIRYRTTKLLLASQEYTEYRGEDQRILLFRQLYSIVRDAYQYGDRPETEKDRWDMRKMELPMNLARGQRHLNFTLISQPWLRQLAKEFMKYQITRCSVGDSYQKLKAIGSFSQFLGTNAPGLSISEIDRTLIVKYIGFLQTRGLSNRSRATLLGELRVFLETCAHQLCIEGVPGERLIFSDDLPKWGMGPSREIPEEVLEQLRKCLNTLDTTMLRMVVILLECGMRISELCSLKLDCLVQDEQQKWYLRSFQIKSKQEHIIPLIDEDIVALIQAQRQDTQKQWGDSCSYLFPSVKSPSLPFQYALFTSRLNEWARKNEIRDTTGALYRFQSHQFRHTVGMRLINNDAPLEVIARLLGHRSLEMTQIYARKYNSVVREEFERAIRRRKTIDSQGKVVVGDARANAADVQLLRKGIRGQTLPVGGCGKYLALGECDHANVCLTCQFWLTSTEDLPRLKAFHSRAIRLKQRATEAKNSVVLENQEKIIPILAFRVKNLEDGSQGGVFSGTDPLAQLQADLERAEVGLNEVQEADLLFTEKYLNRRVIELRARIADLESAAEYV